MDPRRRRTAPPVLRALLRGSAAQGVSVPREELLRARRLYYGMMGWDPETGVPTEAKLAELGL
ncbi:MAG: aldehyde ferredoxin oxidoreductase C-terminal domain-containing protein [Bacillota bacterium]|nr:aldehyde ferredoxin oxidoreductase C-terminal domain-containing protein [Bacillota bacterium]